MELSLSEKSKKIRQVTGWSQRQLAVKIGTTQMEISFIEKGFIPPNTEKIERIEKLYATLNV